MSPQQSVEVAGVESKQLVDMSVINYLVLAIISSQWFA